MLHPSETPIASEPDPGRACAAAAYRHGWFQLAFETELAQGLTPLRFGAHPLLAVRDASGVRVFDAVCPHRGADLGHGSRLAGDSIVCPFHAYRIGLGVESRDGFCAREYASLVAAGGLFVRLSDRSQPDFPGGLAALGAGHRCVPGFEMAAATTVEVVIENGFDNAHFRSVHGLMSLPGLNCRPGAFGELTAEGRFQIPRTGWYETPGGTASHLEARYVAHAFSPGVFVSELDGDPPYRYRVMTTATPAGIAAATTIRLTLILPDAPGPNRDPRFVQELIQHSRNGLEQDRAIWERLDLTHAPRFTASDQAAVAFAEFCRGFRSPAAA
jgi:3-ketosteroid 9alpha-monooxygenase subunit A